MKALFPLFVLLALAAFTPSLYAQGAHDANIRAGKVDRPAVMIEYPFSKGITENAVRDRLEKAGLGKPKSDKGFMSYPGVKWAELSPALVDVHVKVDANKGDNQSSIAILVSKGYDNYINSTTDPAMIAFLKAFLEGLLPDIKAGQLLGEIAGQEEILKRAEKDYGKVDDEGKRLEREKEKLEKQLVENGIEKQKRTEAIIAAKSKLEVLKAGVK